MKKPHISVQSVLARERAVTVAANLMPDNGINPLWSRATQSIGPFAVNNMQY
jgi:hypothetical protein